MTIEFKKTSTVQSYDTTKLLAHDSIVRSDGSEEDTWRDATTSDIAAALAAMGEGERAEVLQLVAERNVPGCVTVRVVREKDLEKLMAERDALLGELSNIHRAACRGDGHGTMAATVECILDAIASARADAKEATARAEKAEAEITEVRRVLGVRENAVTASTAAWRMGEITAATFCAEKAVRERDEARLELDRARASLDVVRHDLDGTRQELREAREDRDSLRTRLIAAESAAAAREPREYPLAEGSRIQGETLVTAGGVRMSIRGQVTHCRGPSLDVKLKCRERYWLPLRDVLALAHRRGLL